MSPELREFVLSLPLDVRLELVKCGGPAWLTATDPKYGAEVETEFDENRHYIADDHLAGRTAWLPVSPIAIALHAAKLVGGRHFVHFGWAERFDETDFEIEDDGNQPGWREYFNGTAQRDPTGHRAAIELLQKVMSEKTP